MCLGVLLGLVADPSKARSALVPFGAGCSWMDGGRLLFLIGLKSCDGGCGKQPVPSRFYKELQGTSKRPQKDM